MRPVNLGKQANLVVVTAVQRCRSFVAGGHAGIEQTSAIVEGEDNNFCACSSSGWPVNRIADRSSTCQAAHVCQSASIGCG